ncbi:hypothetical protein [Janthinobacterium agaricidamnosum]|uniref:Uncharacterized protein n=1 Tax=Janthinobacterium agaricidamnosum NBRC 102515 = DSM 9628 TaxID=1349767 RepID=W0V9A4_9BURK|nr:hypothetical protein [Janthinobacterium agaricidamnosum]CDG83867.1 hypothetical protein GJA_3246 [Janthinobacterium agaricidamnosum NBRC 102515 = DSM 9628]
MTLMCLALAGCQTVKPPAGAGGNAPHDAAGAPVKPGGDDLAATWFNPPAEFPGICMKLANSGALHFVGGFTFYNPGHWSYDAAKSELRIQLGGNQAFPLETAQYQLQQHAGSLLRIDAAKRTLVYAVGPETDTLHFGGFVFYRKIACPN